MSKYFVVAVENRIYKEAIVKCSVLDKFNTGSIFHIVGPDGVLEEKAFKTVQSLAINSDYFGNLRLSGLKHMITLTPILKLKLGTHRVVGFKDGLIEIEYKGKIHSVDVRDSLVTVSNEEYSRMNKLKLQQEEEKEKEQARRELFESVKERELIDDNKKVRDAAEKLAVPNISSEYAKNCREQIEEDMLIHGKTVTLDNIMDSAKLEENIINDTDLTGIKSCPICNGSGYYTDGFGIRYTCACVSEKHNRIRAAEDKFRTFKPVASAFDINTAVIKGIIPEHKKSQEYSRELYQKTLNKLCYSMRLGGKKESIANYFNTLDEILFNIRNGKLPEISYLMYSLNGCGKGTFANTCLKILFAQGKKCVPYTTAKELAEKRAEYNKKLTFGRIDDGGDDSLKYYTWKDYINADLVFTQVANGGKDPYVEFDVLSELLTMRASRNKPTIVFIERPVTEYMNNSRINETFMLNHYTDLRALATMSRLFDVSMILGIRRDA